MSVVDAYQRGHVSFMGIDLLVAQGARVPREETELLGHTAVSVLREQGYAEARVIDMCCGAGNLACAIASLVPDVRVWASDLTLACVEVARRNVVHTGLGDRVQVLQGDLFAAFAGLGLGQTIDVIVCNPPYISEKRLEGDRASLLVHEPREAFAAGPYGLGIHQRVVKEAAAFLKPQGWLLFEFGLGQERQVQMLFDRSKLYGDVRLVRNQAGEPRVAIAQRKVG